MDEQMVLANDTRNRINELLAAGEVTQAALAKQIGISSGALSSFLTGNYRGNNENIAKKLLAAVESAEVRENAVLTVKEPEIIETNIMREMWFGLDYASKRNSIVVIYGDPGIGKTVAIETYVKTNINAIFLTAGPNTRSGRDIMEELLEAGNKKAEGRNRLLEKNIIAMLKGSNRMIIIDEAHFLRLDGLETLRRIYDATKCPLVMVGNPKIMEIITEKNRTITGQFFSRSVRLALDSKVPMEDVEGIVLQNGVSLAAECLKELHAVANQIGALRLMTNLFIVAWSAAINQKENISLDHILAAKKVIVSV